MLSEAGKIYERSRQIKPFSREKREKIYSRRKISISQKSNPQKKYLPFNTVSRIKRDSYLLRVTKQPNTQTNYWANYNMILKEEPKPTIDKASFQRIIGMIQNQDYRIQLSPQAKSKCKLANKPLARKDQHPLTVKDCHKWRKTFQNLDFSKQSKQKNEAKQTKMKDLQSTNGDFMKTLQEVTESNFNNFRRFSLQSKSQKAHNFSSDSGHKYLHQIDNKPKMPEYNILNGDESIIIKSASKVKGWPLFPKYREKVITKYDNPDPNWNSLLNYKIRNQKKNQTIDFNKTTNRLPNTIHSDYPMRISLSRTLNL